MDGRRFTRAARRPGLIVVENSLVTPPGSEAVLRRLGLLAEFEKILPKTPDEDKAVAAAIESLNDVRTNLGLEAVELDPDHIHVVDEGEFWERYGNSRRAFTEFGHVFLPRRYLLFSFIQDLTHEVVHLSSLRTVIDPAQPKDKWVLFMRSGFSPLDSNAFTQRWRFSGFNEAVTELIAVEVRKRFVARVSLLNESLTAELVRGRSYRVQVYLVEELLKLAGGRDPESAERMLFTDYFNRTTRFLNRLARTRRDAIRLMSMMATDAETADVAESLGFNEAAAAMRSYMNRRRRR